MRIPFFGEIVSRNRMQPVPRKPCMLTEITLPYNKRDLKSYLAIMNYLGKFSPLSTELC